MKLSNILDQNFKNVLARLSIAGLPSTVAYELEGFVSKVEDEFAKYEKVRQNLLKRYGKSKEDGSLETNNVGMVQFEGENEALFHKELAALHDAEVEVSKLKTKLSDVLHKVGDVSVEEIRKLKTIFET